MGAHGLQAGLVGRGLPGVRWAQRQARNATREAGKEGPLRRPADNLQDNRRAWPASLRNRPIAPALPGRSNDPSAEENLQRAMRANSQAHCGAATPGRPARAQPRLAPARAARRRVVGRTAGWRAAFGEPCFGRRLGVRQRMAGPLLLNHGAGTRRLLFGALGDCRRGGRGHSAGAARERVKQQRRHRCAKQGRHPREGGPAQANSGVHRKNRRQL